MNTRNLLLCLSILVFSGCISQQPHSTAEMATEGEPAAGTPITIKFVVKDPKGKKTGDLEIIHEKPMHLFMVSRDLSQYFHEHPEKQGDGTYRLPFEFPNGGTFKIFIDFKVRDEEQVVEAFDLNVEGKEKPAVELVPEDRFEKTVGGIRVRMDPGGEIRKHTDVFLKYQVFDSETSKPVADLENYLGEKAHFVIVRKGLGRFIHAHPMSSAMKKPGAMAPMNDEKHKAVMKELKGMPDRDSRVIAMANFPNSGIYKIFAQFKREGEIITVPFVFEVR